MPNWIGKSLQGIVPTQRTTSKWIMLEIGEMVLFRKEHIPVLKVNPGVHAYN